MELADLSERDMLVTRGGSGLYCWGGGVMTVLGIMAGNAPAAAAGLWFIYTYCEP